MLKVNEARLEKERADFQAKYDNVVAKAKSAVANIPSLSDEGKERITAQLVVEYGGDCKQKLDYINSFFDEVADEQ